jgi:hypothetical protein
MRVGYATWSLDVTLGWNARYDPECITITPTANDAAFQLSSMAKRDGVITDEEIRVQASHKPEWKSAASPVSFAKFRGAAVSYVSEGIFWRRLWLAHEKILLVVTVNCAPERFASYEPDVLRMLESLAPEHVDA